MMHGLIRASHDAQVRVLEDFWRKDCPDLVVSLIPHYNRALKQSLDAVWPGTPYVTLLTDIADYPPNFWIEKMDQWVICGSSRAVGQARQIGIPPGRIREASGMILHPKFYEPLHIDRAAERHRLGLNPDVPVGLVLFGGEGSTAMVRIARALNDESNGVQLILLCGRNEAVASELRDMPKRIPMVVEGFTRDVHYYMGLSDFFVGKPGPGSISEALANSLPVIVQRNAWTMAHERYNTEWLEELGAGIMVGSFSREIAGAVRSLLAPGHYAKYCARAASVNNVAVFEIPDMLGEILAESSRYASPAAAVTTSASPG